MTCWDNKFLSSLIKLCVKIYLYFQYVDYIVIGLKGIQYGWSFCTSKNKFIFDNQTQSTLPANQHTFSQLQLIANSLDRDIQMTVDMPSLNESGRLPVLDLGLRVVNNKIETSFFSKPMSSPFQIHFKSAMAMRTKRETLLQEGLWRLRNQGPQADQLENRNLMSSFMN